MIRAVLVAVLLLLPVTGWAHGTGSRVTTDRAVVLDLHYSDGEAMSYADVQAFAPSETVAFLHARADRPGRAGLRRGQPGGKHVRTGPALVPARTCPVAPG